MTDADRIASLEARLRLLEDREEIRDLRDAYHACVNDGRYDEIANLFTDDAVVELGYLAHYTGRAEIDGGAVDDQASGGMTDEYSPTPRSAPAQVLPRGEHVVMLAPELELRGSRAWRALVGGELLGHSLEVARVSIV